MLRGPAGRARGRSRPCTPSRAAASRRRAPPARSSSHGTGAAPESAIRSRRRAGRRDADERERPALPVHRLQVDARVGGGHLELEDQLVRLERRRRAVVVRRQPVELGEPELAPVGADARAEREQRRGGVGRDAPRRRARSRRTRARGAAPPSRGSGRRRAGSRGTRAASTSSASPGAGCRRSSPSLRSCGDAARRQASRSASGICGSASSSASVVPAPIVCPSMPRGHDAGDVDEQVRCDRARRAAAARARCRPRARPRRSRAPRRPPRRTQAAGAATGSFLRAASASRSARSISSRVIGSERRRRRSRRGSRSRSPRRSG